MSSENVKDQLEVISLAMEIAQALATVMIAVAGFLYSTQEKRAAEYNQRRQLLSEASSQIDMDFALDVFRNRAFDKYTINENDYHKILSSKIKFPPEPWHRRCRSGLLVFLETIRPVAHILGDEEHGGFAVEGQVDPILFKFRLSILAMGDFWSPQGGLYSCCNDEHRRFIRDAYGDEYEWNLLINAIARIGMDGRLRGPWDDVFVKDDHVLVASDKN